MKTYWTNKATQYNNPNKNQTRLLYIFFFKATQHRNQTYPKLGAWTVLLKVAAVYVDFLQVEMLPVEALLVSKNLSCCVRKIQNGTCYVALRN